MDIAVVTYKNKLVMDAISSIFVKHESTYV